MSKKDKAAIAAGATPGVIAGGIAGHEIGQRLGYKAGLKKAKEPGIRAIENISKSMKTGGRVGAVVGAAGLGATAGALVHRALKKKASVNIYLEKLAALGTIGKSLIRTKLGPALSGASKGQLANVETRSRIALGSKAKPNVLTSAEKSRHTEGVLNFIKKRAPSLNYTGPEANKVMAVAARAKKMGVV